jgi:hypothetical protein
MQGEHNVKFSKHMFFRIHAYLLQLLAKSFQLATPGLSAPGARAPNMSYSQNKPPCQHRLPECRINSKVTMELFLCSRLQFEPRPQISSLFPTAVRDPPTNEFFVSDCSTSPAHKLVLCSRLQFEPRPQISSLFPTAVRTPPTN